MYTCIDRIKNTNGITRYYLLEDNETHEKIQITPNELKDKIKSKSIEVDNIKLDSKGKLSKNAENLSGRTFGNWIVIENNGSIAKCKCNDCGNEKEFKVSIIRRGRIPKCSTCKQLNKEKDLKNCLIGQTFGNWKILEYHPELNKYKCEYQSENKTIEYMTLVQLNNEKYKPYGYKESFKDIKDMQFGLWKVLEYLGNGMWKCECQCENKTIRSIYGGSLRAGRTTSCGCNKNNKRFETLTDRYNERSTVRINSNRETWQIEALSTDEKLEKYLRASCDGLKTVIDIASELGVSYSTIYNRANNLGLLGLFNMNEFSSKGEREVREYINEIYNGEVIYNCRNIIHGELDIYIPDKKLAIEFNGNYWHSTLNKSKKYHQDKTLASINAGIQLIHIFEYEWNDLDKQLKIKKLIKRLLDADIIRIGARQTEIKPINSALVYEFEEKYHLQGKALSSINLGCFFDNELIGIMTFGKPRFNSDYEYELIRLCWKDNLTVIGGTKKLFKYFINNYKPSSILTYSDLSKFTGKVYLGLGFKIISDEYYTEPNYVWFNTRNKQVLPRYKTQKHKLIEVGLGDESQTEDEIMHNNNYIKIYDSGSIKLVWIPEK